MNSSLLILVIVLTGIIGGVICEVVLTTIERRRRLERQNAELSAQTSARHV